MFVCFFFREEHCIDLSWGAKHHSILHIQPSFNLDVFFCVWDVRMLGKNYGKKCLLCKSHPVIPRDQGSEREALERRGMKGDGLRIYIAVPSARLGNWETLLGTSTVTSTTIRKQTSHKTVKTKTNLRKEHGIRIGFA